MGRVIDIIESIIFGIIFLLAIFGINYVTSEHFGFYILPKWVVGLKHSDYFYIISGILDRVYYYEGECYNYADYKIKVGENLVYYVKGEIPPCKIGENISIVLDDIYGYCWNGVANATVYNIREVKSCIPIAK